MKTAEKKLEMWRMDPENSLPDACANGWQGKLDQRFRGHLEKMDKTLIENLFGSIREWTKSRGNEDRTQKEEDIREQSPASGTGLCRPLSLAAWLVPSLLWLTPDVLFVGALLQLKTWAPPGRAWGLPGHCCHASWCQESASQGCLWNVLSR